MSPSTDLISTGWLVKSMVVEPEVACGVTAVMFMAPRVVFMAARPAEFTVAPLKPRAKMLMSPTPALIVAGEVALEPRIMAATALLDCTLPIGALKLAELNALVVAAPPPMMIGAPEVVEVGRPPVESITAPALCL